MHPLIYHRICYSLGGGGSSPTPAAVAPPPTIPTPPTPPSSTQPTSQQTQSVDQRLYAANGLQSTILTASGGVNTADGVKKPILGG
jgi:hypothetical protein